MYRNILVPLDLSRRAEAILPHVEQLAQRYNAKVIFLHVVQPDKIFLGPEVPSQRHYFEELNRKMKTAEAYLAELKEQFQQKGIHTQEMILSGAITEMILTTAENQAVDLIAIASHGWGGLSRVFYGSVAASVLHKIDRPLLLIRSRENQ